MERERCDANGYRYVSYEEPCQDTRIEATGRVPARNRTATGPQSLGD